MRDAATLGVVLFHGRWWTTPGKDLRLASLLAEFDAGRGAGQFAAETHAQAARERVAEWNGVEVKRVVDVGGCRIKVLEGGFKQQRNLPSQRSNSVCVVKGCAEQLKKGVRGVTKDELRSKCTVGPTMERKKEKRVVPMNDWKL